jgi:Flp pilus assembly protein TadD
LEKVIAIQPMSYEAHYQLGGIRERQERLDDAQRHFRTAAQSKPDSLDALSSLGILSFRLGKMSDAFETFDTLARTHAGDAEFHMRAGLAAASLQRTADAIRHLNEAQRLRPSWPPPLYTLAWLLATHPDATQRNGTDALKLANRASELTQSSNPRCLDVLAAALAETGNFAEAAAMQRKAITVAAAASPPIPVDEFKLRLELYQGGKAYRQPRVESPKP